MKQGIVNMRTMKHRTIRLAIASCLLLLLGATVSSADAVPARQVTLAENGRTSYVITVGNDATAPERNAAKELASYLGWVTGVKFAVMSPSEAPDGQPCILVGQTKSVKKLLPDLDWKSLGYDGIVIKAQGQHLILAGGRPRGTLYAVYTFLEDIVGCRWWTSSEEDVPYRPNLTFDAPNITYVPALHFRDTDYADIGWNAKNEQFCVKLKNNGHYNHNSQEWGGQRSVVPDYGHTFFSLLPPKQYFGEHPEWYGVQNGKRTFSDWSDAQLCLTNVEMRKQLAQNALELLRKRPGAGIIQVGQMDGYGQCQCDVCKASTEREGSAAGALIETVNVVAEAVEKEFPHVLIKTLAYHWTRKPPLYARPRDNVVVHLCGLENDFAQPVDSDANALFREHIEGWSAISRQLWIWHYTTNYVNAIQPYPNIFTIGSDVRFFVKNSATGIFINGDGFNNIGDSVRLRAWIITHMLWDPSRDPLQLAREFTRGYYGPAGPYVFDYVMLAHEAVKQSGMRLNHGNHYDTSFFSLDQMNEATRLWDRARAAVADKPTLLARVRREQIPFDLLWLQNWAWLKLEAERKNQDFLGPKDVRAGGEAYLKTALEFIHTLYGGPVLYYVNANPRVDVAESVRAACRQQLAVYSEKPAELPEEVRGLESDQYRILQWDTHEEFLSAGAESVEDPLASNGKAVRLEVYLSAVKWFTRARFTGRWRCYVQVRSDAKEMIDNAFELQTFDMFIWPYRALVQEVVPLNKVSPDAYQTYDLGVHDLKPGINLRIRLTGVTPLYVDRMFIVREDAR
jgi:hypothetical protein